MPYASSCVPTDEECFTHEMGLRNRASRQRVEGGQSGSDQDNRAVRLVLTDTIPTRVRILPQLPSRQE